VSARVSVDVPEVDHCAFCDYLSGRRPYTVLARGELTALLVTREQRGVAHLLAIPVAHRPTLLDLLDQELGAVMFALREGARAIIASETPAGVAVWQNNGMAADQAIPHFHFHVAGTLVAGGTERGDVPELSIEETERIAARLRHAAVLDLK
jgi:histidine triad (HIT) family protein